MTTTRTIPVTLIRGDGIGPEIMDATLLVLEALGAPFVWEEQSAGLSAFNADGDPLPKKTVESIRKNRLAFKGPLTTPVGTGFRSINVRLREEFKLFANLRPAYTLSPNARFEDIDIVLIRENNEGFYVGLEHFIPIDDDPKAVAEGSGFITRKGCERVSRFAFEYAVSHGRKKVTIIHKANILKALTGLFLETAMKIGEEYKGRLVIDERIVDNCAMQLVMNPTQFDVLLTTNMFGDILSDLIAGLIGGLGVAPGGNIGKNAAIFEAVHGSAPDIAGKGIANPTSLMLAAAMMLEHVGEHEKAGKLRSVLGLTIRDDAICTTDLGGKASTQEFAAAVVARLKAS